MKSSIISLVEKAIETLICDQIFPIEVKSEIIHVERTKNADHGDFACNISMKLAKLINKKPLEIASYLVIELRKNDMFYSVNIAGPGFINFKLSNIRYNDLIIKIIREGVDFGKEKPLPNTPKTILEFVSSNPTGPLHVGHGRGAAYGATLANLLRASGNIVDNEYYVNDAGRQMDILALSVYLRYLQKLNIKNFIYPRNIYQADYCSSIANDIFNKSSDKYIVSDDFFINLPVLEYEKELINIRLLEDKLTYYKSNYEDNSKNNIDLIKKELEEYKKKEEQLVDELIYRAKKELGTSGYSVFFDSALNTIIRDIRDDLSDFGVDFQSWYSEKKLFSTNKISNVIDLLKEKGHLYRENGALWFRTTAFGDEKDRVVQRDNGSYTYFASDIAYHNDKFERGYEKIIDVFGADHHGYMARVRGAMIALGHDVKKLHFEIVQFAVLYKDGKKMQMSTRSGQYVTLRDLRNRIGNSAVRFFYVMRKPQQHMDFDLDLAVSASKDNPLYYIQYAHARICQLLDKVGYSSENHLEGVRVDKLNSSYELSLLRVVEKYPEMIKLAANDYAPHQVIHYLKELATCLHSYYDAANIKFLDKSNLQNTRFSLLLAVKQILENGLHISGVDAPKKM